jgi:3'-5' exoribonuclease
MNTSIKVPNAEQFLDFVLDWTKDEKLLPLINHVYNMPGFFKLPATISEKHHDYVGGLAVHTWEVMHLCRASAESPVRKPRPVDAAVLAVSAMWHDMGKTRYYAQQEVNFQTVNRKSATGTLGNTHIMLALIEWGKIVETWGEFPLDSTQSDKVTHCIGGHHGKLAWGSPVVPNSQEAVILHHADVQSVMLGGGINPELRDR